MGKEKGEVGHGEREVYEVSERAYSARTEFLSSGRNTRLNREID